MGGAGAVASFIGDRCREGIVVAVQRAHVSRRDANAPVAGCIQHCRVVFAVQGHGDDVACLRAGHGAGHRQRLAVLGAVDHVIAGDGVEGDLRHSDVNQNRRTGARRVARLIGHGGSDSGMAISNAHHIRCRNVQRPAAVGLNLRHVLLAVEGHGDRLACFGA